MPLDKSIKTVQEYGCIELRLKEWMDQNDIPRGTLARNTDTRYEVINKWYQGHVEKMDLDVLARICCVLDCEVSDIIQYKKVEN